MKKSIFIITVLLTSFWSSNIFARDTYYTRVADVEPIYSESITREPMVVGTTMVCERGRIGSGAILGGATGGLIGSQFGRGAGRLASTGLGVFIGSITGSQLDSPERCYEKERVEYVQRRINRITGYIIRLENGDEFHSTRRYNIGEQVRMKVHYE